MDPLSEVALGQGGTGRAAILPGTTYDPVAHVAGLVAKKEADKAAKKKEKKEALLRNIKLQDIDYKAWDIDDKRELAKDMENFRRIGPEYLAKGIDPTNPENYDAFIDVKQKEDALMVKANASQQQQKIHNDQLKALFTDEGRTKYNVEQSMANLNKFKEATIDERIQMGQNLLVKKELDLQKDLEDNLLTTIKAMETTGQYAVPTADGGIKTVKTNQITEEDLKLMAKSRLNDPDVLSAVQAQYEKPENKSVYETMEDFYYGNYFKPLMKKEVIQSRTKGFKGSGDESRTVDDVYVDYGRKILINDQIGTEAFSIPINTSRTLNFDNAQYYDSDDPGATKISGKIEGVKPVRITYTDKGEKVVMGTVDIEETRELTPQEKQYNLQQGYTETGEIPKGKSKRQMAKAKQPLTGKTKKGEKTVFIMFGPHQNRLKQQFPNSVKKYEQVESDYLKNKGLPGSEGGSISDPTKPSIGW